MYECLRFAFVVRRLWLVTVKIEFSMSFGLTETLPCIITGSCRLDEADTDGVIASSLTLRKGRGKHWPIDDIDHIPPHALAMDLKPARATKVINRDSKFQREEFRQA